MNILICKSASFGGADYLLDRYYWWLKKNNIFVEQMILSENIIPPKIQYDIAILPSYIMNDIYQLKKDGYVIERILLWIMGMGCFQDGYYNPNHELGIKGLITKLLKKEADKALEKITEANAICFTDVVGRYNTYKKNCYCNEEYENNNLIPIGIKLSTRYKREKRVNELRICWVGRVAFDFKYIPLIKALKDIEEYCNTTDLNIHFTIVGSGDALLQVKNISKELSYHIEFIDFLPYEQLNTFFQNQDIAFGMGTSSLDAARNYCPSVVITPVRPKIDREEVFYRWIYESKGYSLGEYPGLDEKTNQVRKKFANIIEEYNSSYDIPIKCYEYAKQYDEDVVFNKLLNRALPEKIDKKLWKYIRNYYYIKKIIKIYTKIK